MAGHLNMKRRSPGEWLSLLPSPPARVIVRVCASASDGSLRLFNRFRIFRGPHEGGGRGISLCLTSCRYSHSMVVEGHPVFHGGARVGECVSVRYIYNGGPDLRRKGNEGESRVTTREPRKRRVTRALFSPLKTFSPFLFSSLLLSRRIFKGVKGEEGTCERTYDENANTRKKKRKERILKIGLSAPSATNPIKYRRSPRGDGERGEGGGGPGFSS